MDVVDAMTAAITTAVTVDAHATPVMTNGCMVMLSMAMAAVTTPAVIIIATTTAVTTPAVIIIATTTAATTPAIITAAIPPATTTAATTTAATLVAIAVVIIPAATRAAVDQMIAKIAKKTASAKIVSVMSHAKHATTVKPMHHAMPLLMQMLRKQTIKRRIRRRNRNEM